MGKKTGWHVDEEVPLYQCSWASEGGFLPPPGFWNFQQKKVVFLVSRGKIKFHHFLPHPGKIQEKSQVAPPAGKNPSEAHASVTES